jgi:hypothetical protein
MSGAAFGADVPAPASRSTTGDALALVDIIIAHDGGGTSRSRIPVGH